METSLYSIYNPATQRILAHGIASLDASQDPLRALQVMIDGPALHFAAGIWLAPLNAIPFVPRLAAYDVIFLAQNESILAQQQLQPGEEYPSLAQIPTSILILPSGSIGAFGAAVGDSLILYVPSAPGSAPSHEVISAALAANKSAARALKEPAPLVVDLLSAAASPQAPASPAQKKKSPLLRFLRWVDPTLVTPPDLRASARRPAPELVAYRWSNGISVSYDVGDISSTGIYLLTDEKWELGSQVTLIMQRVGPPEPDMRRQVTMHAEVVRHGDHGIGLRFHLPLGMDMKLWQSVHPGHSDMTKPEYVVNEFRFAAALAFLQRICPQAAAGLRTMMETELGIVRSECAVDILLLAEEMLLREKAGDKFLVHPAILLRILETGSWAEQDFIRQFWAGILVTSCSPTGLDTENLMHIDTLSLLRPVHFQLLANVCTRRAEPGQSDARLYDCTPDELTKITGTSDLTPIYRAVGLLGELGLVERAASSTYAFGEKIRLRPTPAGHLLLTRCVGERVKP